MSLPIYIFAKAPIAGQAKTRLSPNCSKEQAAKIASILLQNTVSIVKNGWAGKVYLSVAGNVQNPVIDTILQDKDIHLHRQCQGDLGAKMLDVFEQNTTPCAIVGADIANLTPQLLQYAHSLLLEKKNVIGPCEDGGYWLIGLQTYQPILFDRVSWGEAKVFDSTIKQAKQKEIKLEFLETLNDIDYWQDVMGFYHHVAGLKEYLIEQTLL